MSSKEKEKRDFPRNIRQIGDPGKEKRIYPGRLRSGIFKRSKGSGSLWRAGADKGSARYFMQRSRGGARGRFLRGNWNYVTEEAESLLKA